MPGTCVALDPVPSQRFPVFINQNDLTQIVKSRDLGPGPPAAGAPAFAGKRSTGEPTGAGSSVTDHSWLPAGPGLEAGRHSWGTGSRRPCPQGTCTILCEASNILHPRRRGCPALSWPACWSFLQVFRSFLPYHRILICLEILSK